MSAVDPGTGIGDLFAQAGITVATPTAQSKGDTGKANPVAATAWAYCPRCGPSTTKRRGLVRLGHHYVWAIHTRMRETGSSVMCGASGTALCEVPPWRCSSCMRPGGGCPPGEHRAPVLLRQAERHERAAYTPGDTDWHAERVPAACDDTCLRMHPARYAPTPSPEDQP